MPAIGPYSFATMDGRLVSASSPSIPTARGLRVTRRRARPSVLRTVQEHTTFVDAWITAAWYRAAIGAVTAVVDDGGLLCPAVLIADVRTSVHAAAGGAGAILETAWTAVPSIDFGDYGEAQFVDLGEFAQQYALAQPMKALATSSSILVGGIPFDTATGNMQWPITIGQVEACILVAKMMQVDDVVQPPSLDQGSLFCTVGLASESDAFDRMRLVRLLAGNYVTVEIGGVVIPYVAVMDTVPTWDEVVGLPSGQTVLLAAEFQLNVAEVSGSETPFSVAVVQTAKVWGAWETVVGAHCDASTEGLNGAAGSATWVRELGKTMRSGRTVTAEPKDTGEQWARICYRARSDGKPDLRGMTLVPAWHGVVLSTEIDFGSHLGGSSELTVAAGIAAALDKVEFTRWYESGQVIGGGPSMADPGEMLPINHTPGGDGGGLGIDELNGVVIQDRRRTDSNGIPAPKRMTAHQLVLLILAAARAQYPQGPRWQLAGNLTALDFVGMWDLRHRSALAMLAEVLSPRWGLTFRLEVDGTDVTVRVNTTVRANTAIAGFGVFPANDRPAAIDLRGKDVVTGKLRRDYAQAFDRIIIEGGPSWYCQTLSIGIEPTFELVEASTAAQRTSWQGATVLARGSDALATVFRRYKLRDNYRGGTYFASLRNDLLRMVRQIGGDGLSETGDFTVQAGMAFPKAANLRFTRELPIWQGVDWTTVGRSSSGDTLSKPGLPIEGPLLFGRKTNLTYEILTHKWQVHIEEDGAAVILGRDAADALEIYNYLHAGNKILITIGYRYPLPWRISWRRKQDERPRDLERTITLRFPDLFHRRVVSGTVVGITDPTTLKQTAGDTLIDWDVTPDQPQAVSKLAPLLDLAKLFATAPAKAISYTRKGVLDVTTALAPGSLATDITIPLDQQRTIIETIDAPITGRELRYGVDQIATAYTCERLPVCVDRFHMANHVAALGVAAIPMLGKRYG